MAAKRWAGTAALLLGACASAAAAAAGERDPLSIPLREYGLVLGTALLGGFVSWVRRVRAGHTHARDLMGLVGELCTSAFSGLLAFWCCGALGVSPMMTAVTTGIAGHAGTRALQMIERELQRRAGIPPELAPSEQPESPHA